MKSILFGNGLNIKFGGEKYCNRKILHRGINYLRQDKKIQKICPPQTIKLFEVMFQCVPDILNGVYDEVALDCMKELTHFKATYSGKRITDIGQIGLEDYFLIIHLIYTYQRLFNTEVDAKKVYSIGKEKEASQLFRDLCLVGIYNRGKINQLNTRFSDNFIKYINTFDEVFTTNYDLNLDTIFYDKVKHIHGQFNVLDQIYDPNSFRNSLSDHPFEKNNLINIPGYEYLHSTALMNYSGKNKFEQMKNEHNLNNITIENIEKLPTDMVDRKTIDLALEAKKAMEKDSSLRFQEYDAYNDFKMIHGGLTIIGLSPTNDNHIFGQLDNLKVTFYYYSNNDKELAKLFLPKDTIFKDVNELWKILK